MKTQTINRAHKNKIPFFMGGVFYDYESGDPYFNTRKFSGPYEGDCFVGQTVFTTGIEKETGERFWRVSK